MIPGDDLAQILGIESRRQRGRADQIAKHHRQLAPFGIGWRRCIARCRRQRGNGHRGAERGNRIEQPAAVAKRADAQLLQVFGRQSTQDFAIDIIITEKVRRVVSAFAPVAGGTTGNVRAVA
jgi:hypothetical protein